jgi:MtN3 and saliva related transmembrane protein
MGVRRGRQVLDTSWTAVLGFAAACCSTLAFLPQVLKTWRSRSARDISLATFSVMITGSLLWMAYAWLQKDMPVLVTNAIIFVLGGTILYLKLRYGWRLQRRRLFPQALSLGPPGWLRREGGVSSGGKSTVDAPLLSTVIRDVVPRFAGV